MKKELASGKGTASSFSCRSAIGRGRGLVGMSGSSSSSSPTMWKKPDSRICSAISNLLAVVVMLKHHGKEKQAKNRQIKQPHIFVKKTFIYVELHCTLYMAVTEEVWMQPNFRLCYKLGSENRLSLIIMMRGYYT